MVRWNMNSEQKRMEVTEDWLERLSYHLPRYTMKNLSQMLCSLLKFNQCFGEHGGYALLHNVICYTVLHQKVELFIAIVVRTSNTTSHYKLIRWNGMCALLIFSLLGEVLYLSSYFWCRLSSQFIFLYQMTNMVQQVLQTLLKPVFRNWCTTAHRCANSSS
jgi:hypothetical protein